MAVLKNFQDLNSVELSVEVVGSFLRRSYSDIYSLDWRRFEEIVDGIFRQQGFETVLTQRTKDGGADVLLLSNGSIQAIVECKKYGASRTVGIAAVRSLLGACVDWGVRRAYLVTTSRISKAAQIKATELRKQGYDIDLVAATELASLLKVYNASLPGLDQLDEHARAAIIERWQPPQSWRIAGR